MTDNQSPFRKKVYATEDGIKIVADIGGDLGCPNVILAHGGGQTRHSWSQAMRRLVSAGYYVVNYDARGHGDSQWSLDNAYPMERRWADMEMIASTLTGKVAIVGASMGGGTALFGVSQGFRPDALVLVDIAPNSDRRGMQRVQDFMESGLPGFATLEEAADAVARYNPDRPRSKNPKGLMRNLRLKKDGRLYWHWDPGMLDIDIDEERIKLGQTFDGLSKAAGLPVMLVRGLQSDVVTEETVAEFRERFPRLEVFEVSGAGHMVAGDRNDVFTDALSAFITRHMPV